MYKLKTWSEDLDLNRFYEDAAARGFENNSSQKMLVDCFRKETEWQVWILFYNDRPVGSVAAHSFPEMGNNAYRICARTCVFSDLCHIRTGRTLSQIKTHQNHTAQYFIPACIEWAGKDKDLYITSNESSVGSQRLVHKIYCPALVETGALEKSAEIFYRGTYQTAWRLDVEVFLEQINQNERWPLG